jgi:hypothetical protein
VDQVLGQILRQAVWERLDMLDELASNADNGSLLSVARSELPRLTHGWRALLASHAPDHRGRCPECSGNWRDRAASCSVWRAAHEHLVSADPAPSGVMYSGSGPVKVDTVKVDTVKVDTVKYDTARSEVPRSVFSRLRARRSAWQARQSSTLFGTAVPAGAGATR